MGSEVAIACSDRLLIRRFAIGDAEDLIPILSDPKVVARLSTAPIRAIIDHLKERSGWEDADFQTWRLIMKRALSSPATTLEEFIALEDAAEESFDGGAEELS